MTWGQNEWLWAIGIVIAALISFVITRQYANRRRKLLFTWDAVQLLPNDGPAQGALEVFYEGTEVKDPYLVKVAVRNLGPTDIATAHFDNSTPLRVEFPQGYVAHMDTDTGAAPIIELGRDYLAVHPQLLKRHAIVTLDVLVDGPTTPKLISHIIDTDIVTVDPREVALGLVGEVGGGGNFPAAFGNFFVNVLRGMRAIFGGGR